MTGVGVELTIVRESDMDRLGRILAIGVPSVGAYIQSAGGEGEPPEGLYLVRGVVWGVGEIRMHVLEVSS